MQEIFTNLQISYIIILGDGMKEKLIYDINQYITYLNNSGLFVTVHGKGISGLLEHNIHRHPFCSLVKTDRNAWDKCIRSQQKVFKQYRQDCLFGMCHAGMEEYVFFVNDKTFVSVSGYGVNKNKATERIGRLSQEFFLNKSELLRIYETTLKHQTEDTEALNTLIKPLCHMLSLLQILLTDIPETETKNAVFNSLLAYVQHNFMNDITIWDIAHACVCSESTVSHLFRQYMGKSVKKYIAELRINQAKKLLSTSDLPIGTVAQMCGFSNIGYFPTAFKKAVGLSPTEYCTQTRGRRLDTGGSTKFAIMN